jgi:ABC-type hemin transport system ATPase subunit
MGELLTDLLILALICANPISYACGRWVEHRRWENQRAALGRVLVSQSDRTGADAALIEQQCTVIRDQRHLLEVLTVAAEQVSNERHSRSEAMHRLSWAASQSRKELL